MSNVAWVLIYFGFINFSLYIQMQLDHTRKSFNTIRISEPTLFLLGLAGGAIGGTLAMWIYGHKINKWYFKVLFPIFALIDAYVIYVIATLK